MWTVSVCVSNLNTSIWDKHHLGVLSQCPSEAYDNRPMIRNKLIRQAVAGLRAGIRATEPPVDCSAAAAHCLLTVIEVATLPEGQRGRYRSERAQIEVLQTLAKPEQRFVVSHEIGHHLLEHGTRQCFDTGLVADSGDLSSFAGIDFEREADYFAGEFLVPRAWLKADLDAGLKLDLLPDRYGVTRTALWVAIEIYNLPLKNSARDRQR